MTKKQKIILMIVIIVLVLAIGLSAFFLISKNKEKNEDKFITTANDNSNVIKEQTVDGLKISNVMLVVKEEGSTFTADVTNTTNKEIKGKTIEIIFKTKTDKKVTSMLGYFGDSIKPKETKQISTNIGKKLNKNIIKSVEYKVK